MKKSRIIKASVITFISILALLGVSVLLSVIYKDKIIRLVTANINQHLVTEIKVGEIDFSILRTFPFASVNFHETQALSTTTFNPGDFNVNTDTLFHFEQVSFKFNPIHLLQKKYKVNGIEFVNGQVNLLADNKGNVNYIFWKKKSAKTSENQLELQMKNATLKNVNVVYMNSSKSFVLDAFANRGKLQGGYGNGMLTLKTDIDLHFNELSVKDVSYRINESLNLSSVLAISDEEVAIKNGRVDIQNMKFSINGAILTKKETVLDLNVRGKKIGIVNFISILPLALKDKLKNYTSSGDFDFQTSITGIVSHRQQPSVNANFLVNDGRIHKKRSGAAFNNINLKGSFTNGEKQQLSTSRFEIESFSGTFRGNQINGVLTYENFIQPVFQGSIKGSIDLAELQDFLYFETLNSATGLASVSVDVSGSIQKPDNVTRKDAAGWSFFGNIELKDVALKPKKGPYVYHNLNGTVSLDGHNIHFSQFGFHADENDLLINGSFINGISYLFNSKSGATISADIQSNFLNLTSLAMEQANPEKVSGPVESNEEEKSTVRFPENLNVSGNFIFKEFVFKDFNARNARGKLNYRPRTIVLNSVYFDALNGSVSGGGVIAQRLNNDFTVKAQTKLNNINIQELFSSFNNFGQQVLLSEHLNGALHGYINFSADWNVNLKVYRPSIACESDVKIYDGELIDFTPLLGLSKFIKVSELKHIKFSTLENKVKIENESIIIPQMDIQSSAFNISCSGIHYFDNSYDYKVQLLLSEVLSSRRDTRDKIETEFGEVKKDNLGRTKLYLSISGKGAEYQVGYDIAGSKAALKENIREEKQELKSILKKEFGWFKKDSLQHNDTQQDGSPRFIWGIDEADTTDQHAPLMKNKKEDRNKKQKKYRITWDDE